jgi:hypothetical protein
MRTNTDIILDTEFNSRSGGFKIDPISFALISADGREEFYAVSDNFNQRAANRHEFLVAKVLPKLPPVNERISIPAIREGMDAFFGKIAAATQANQATIWAKNGAMGDFILLDLLFEGRFFEMMNAHGFERTYMQDTYDLYTKAGKPKLGIEIDPEAHHTAIGDVRHERKVFVACQEILAQRKPA